MRTALSGERKETLEDGVIQSLCYLHQEALKEDRQELASVIQTAIEQIEHLIPASVSLSRDTWIRRENAVSGLKGIQSGGPGEYRFCEAFYHR
jgi:hypothetical protein